MTMHDSRSHFYTMTVNKHRMLQLRNRTPSPFGSSSKKKPFNQKPESPRSAAAGDGEARENPQGRGDGAAATVLVILSD